MIDQEKRLFRMLRAALRKVWLWYCPRRKAAFEEAKVGKEWRCAECKKLFPRSGVRCDHVKPCGSLQKWADVQGFVERLFRGPLQILCEADHAVKTAEEAKARRKAK